MTRGFTLVELLLVLAIFGFLFLIVGSISYNSLPKSQLLVEVDVVEQTIRKAQTWSVAQRLDTQWGVYFTTQEMTLFAGSDYATRNQNLDEIHTFPNGISASGLIEIVFSYRTGETDDTGTITLTADTTGESKTLTINELGRVNQ